MGKAVNGKNLSVLFLTRYPIEGASSRYRVYQYIPHLEALGVDCTVQSFMSSDMYALSFSEGRVLKKAMATLGAALARFKALVSWRRYDLIYLQRDLFPFGPPLVERLLKKLGCRIVFDYDDALFIKKPSRYNPIATLLRSPGKTREMLRLADCTVAGNDWLRDVARGEGGRAVTIEVAEDTSRYRQTPQSSKDEPVTIGWLGSPSTVKYLKLIEEPLRRIAARHPDVQWEIVGGGDFAMDGVGWRLTDWSFDEEVAALSRFDIGLMPLPIDEWSKGKSGGKARTYMASGVVPVVAAIGYNLELIRPGETGYLCETQADWETTIDMLITAPEVRQRIADAALADVKHRFSPQGQAQKLADLFADLVSGSIDAR